MTSLAYLLNKGWRGPGTGIHGLWGFQSYTLCKNQPPSCGEGNIAAVTSLSDFCSQSEPSHPLLLRTLLLLSVDFDSNNFRVHMTAALRPLLWLAMICHVFRPI